MNAMHATFLSEVRGSRVEERGNNIYSVHSTEAMARQ